MNKFSNLIESNEIVICDGAWGTMLQQKGLKTGECPELWNLMQSEKVYDVALSYIKSGADIIETNSFGGNRIKLKSFGLDNDCYKLNKSAAEISRKAAGDEKVVLGSVGPTGKILMMGEVKEDELHEVFQEQCTALVDGGVDGILLETFTDIDELKIALRAACENKDVSVGCTMTFDKTVSGEYRTMMGVSPSDMWSEIQSIGIDFIGSNCGNGIENMISISREFLAINTNLPIIIQANAGMPVLNENNETIFPDTPVEMSSKLFDLVESGVKIIGGCCGTTPDHITEFVKIKNRIS